MKQKHTPGPWEWSKHQFNLPPFEGALERECGIYPPSGEAGPVAIVCGEDNAARIVACVNAFEGIEDPEEWMLEAKEERRGFWYEECKRQRSELGGEIARLREEIAELKRQR